MNQQRIDYRTGILASPSEVDAAEWNALLAAQPQPTPFLRHEFLSALNATQCAVPDTGWAPQFVTLTDARTGMRLTGKTAIVTGGGSGFGEGIAKTFAREGANVVVNDLNEPAAERVASEIAIAGGKAIAVPGNVAQRDDWRTLREAALEDFGSVQIVVNNAGTTHRNKPVLEVTEAEFDRVYAVNVKSIYWSVQEFVPYFREQGGGSFINIASTAGVRPRPGLVWYNGSKGAVIVASKSLAVELGPERIRVNCVNPVIGETALLSEFMPALR